MGKFSKWCHTALAVTGLFLGVTLCPPARAADAPKPIYWKQSVFSIPYQINRPATADDAPLEVRLLVSRDAGATWKTLEAAKPQVKGFVYNAEEDGEYWFAVQTVDRFGRLHPPNDIQPELHVVVDTNPPQVDVQGTVSGTGDVVITCRLADDNLQMDNLSVGVRSDDGEFQPLNVSAAGSPQAGAEGSGEIVRELIHTPPLGTRTLQVRAEISDLAGNRGVSQIDVDLLSAESRTAETTTNPMAGEDPFKVARQQTSAARAGSGAWSPAGASRYPETGFGPLAGEHHTLTNPPELADTADGASGKKDAQPWAPDELAVGPPDVTGAKRPRPTHEPTTQDSPQVASSEPLPPPSESAKPAWTTRPASAVAGRSNTGPPSLQGDSYAGAERATATASVDAGSDVVPEEIPPGETTSSVGPIPGDGSGSYPDTGAPLINVTWPNGSSMGPEGAGQGEPAPHPSTPGWQRVNSRTIAIDYEVDSVGPWGVSEVELWGTRDGGQTWRRYAVDDDNRSPVTATVEGEGNYGFKVVVHSAGGFAAAPPKPGDRPEALVHVDLVRPEATIESVQQGTGNAADQIVIRWSADDAQLAANPVTLYYSAQPAGPWSIIAAGLQNTGKYEWRAERHLPEQLYVRLEVRDAAGNTTTFQSAEPVVVRRPRPQVRIRQVRPFGASAAQPGGLPQR